METQELHRYDLVDSFLQSIKNSQSKQQFLNRVQEFDTRFTEEQNGPSYSQKQKSVEKLPPMQPQKPKNPFKSNLEDFRHPSIIQTGQNQMHQSPFLQPQTLRGNYAKTQQNFYKPPSNSAIKTEQYQMGGQYGVNQTNQGGYGGLGLLNYNAYNQKQYDQLKEQFFRPPNIPRPDQYNRMGEGINKFQQEYAYNYGQLNNGLGMSSSSDILPHDNSFSRPNGRGYSERTNPFMKQ